MPNTGFLGWAYISGSTISFDSGVADKQVLFMSGTSVVSGASSFQFDYEASALVLTGNLTASGHVSASTYYGDGSNLSGISASPGGSNTQVQFNNGGAFGGDAGLTYNSTTNLLTVGSIDAGDIRCDGDFEGEVTFQDQVTFNNTISAPSEIDGDIQFNGIITFDETEINIQSFTEIEGDNIEFVGGDTTFSDVISSNLTINSSYRLKNNGSLVNTTSEHYGDLFVTGATNSAGVAIDQLVYYNSSSEWTVLTASTTGSGIDSLIGIATSTSPHTLGVLTRGIIQLTTARLSSSSGAGSLTVGAQVYADPTNPGGYTTVKPTTAGHCVRVVGHSVATTKIFFNPSPDFIEL